MLNSGKKLFNIFLEYFAVKKMEKKFSKPPIIIGGCGRSGTTLMLSILGAHPQIYTFPKETAAFIDWQAQIKYFDKKATLVPRIDRLYRVIMKEKLDSDLTRWCEKSPRNVRYFDNILNYFDNDIKLINMIRDGRDVILSHHPEDPNDYWVEPERWINDVSEGLKYNDNQHVLNVKYENLVKDYKNEIKRICNFIEEDFVEELKSYFKHTSVKNSNAWFGTAEEIHSNSVGKWKEKTNKERVDKALENEKFRTLLEKLNYI